MVRGKRRVWLEFEVQKDFGEQKIGAALWVDETGVLADPAKARPLSEIPLKDRTGIGIPAVFDRASDLRFDKLNQFLHPRREDVVIVIAAGIGSNTTF
jgi:hypothetical protein